MGYTMTNGQCSPSEASLIAGGVVFARAGVARMAFQTLLLHA
jgi:hypothetical protein